MSGKVFLDTNVLVYAYTATEPKKRAQAIMVADATQVWISTQVINELSNTLFRKFHLDWPTIRNVLTELQANFQILQVSPATTEISTRLAEETRYSFYDCLILAAAIEVGAEVVYSEDLQHGHQFRSLTIMNPFLDANIK